MLQNLFRTALIAGLVVAGTTVASAKDKAISLDPDQLVEVVYLDGDAGPVRAQYLNKYRTDAIRGGGDFLGVFEVVAGGDDDASPTHLLITQWPEDGKRASFRRRSIAFQRLAEALTGSDVFTVAEGQEITVARDQVYTFVPGAGAGSADAEAHVALALESSAEALDEPVYEAAVGLTRWPDLEKAEANGSAGLVLRVVR